MLFLLLGLFPVNTSAEDDDLITGNGGRVITNMDIIHGDRSDYIRTYEGDSIGIKEFNRDFEEWDELAAGDVNGMDVSAEKKETEKKEEESPGFEFIFGIAAILFILRVLKK